MAATSIRQFQRDTYDLFNNGTIEERYQKLVHFLPVDSEHKDIKSVRNVALSTIGSENGPIYQYTIQWTEASNGTEKLWRQKIARHVDSTDESMTSSLKSTKSRLSTKGFVSCDGPCGKFVPIVHVVEFGCDHVICDECLKSQKSAALFDGSPGCCNQECVKIARYNGEKLRSGKTTDTSSSLTSLAGPWESLQIHAILCRKVGKNVIRTHLIYEFPSQSRVSSLVKTLYKYQDFLSDSRVFYSNSKPDRQSALNKISLLNTNLRFYDLTDPDKSFTSELWFLIAGKGVKI